MHEFSEKIPKNSQKNDICQLMCTHTGAFMGNFRRVMEMTLCQKHHIRPSSSPPKINFSTYLFLNKKNAKFVTKNK